MRNGTIRLKWAGKHRKIKYRYYDMNDLDKFMKKYRELVESSWRPIHVHVYWNGIWHSCHGIHDLLFNLSYMRRDENRMRLFGSRRSLLSKNLGNEVHKR